MGRPTAFEERFNRHKKRVYEKLHAREEDWLHNKYKIMKEAHEKLGFEYIHKYS